MPKRSSSQPRKKQKGKKGPPPGVFISSFLGSSGGERKSRANNDDGHNREGHVKAVEPKVPAIHDASCNSIQAQYNLYNQNRTVLEFALITLAYGDTEVKQQVKRMAGTSKEGAQASGPTWTRFINPVQDLGRSLINFLVGDPRLHEEATNNTPNKRDSIISINSNHTNITGLSTPGRTRPIGHPANSRTTTPVVVRRTKTAGSIARSLEARSVNEILSVESAGKPPHAKPPVAGHKPPPGPGTRQKSGSTPQVSTGTHIGIGEHAVATESGTGTVDVPPQKKKRKNKKGSISESESLSSSAKSNNELLILAGSNSLKQESVNTRNLNEVKIAKNSGNNLQDVDHTKRGKQGAKAKDETVGKGEHCSSNGGGNVAQCVDASQTLCSQESQTVPQTPLSSQQEAEGNDDSSYNTCQITSTEQNIQVESVILRQKGASFKANKHSGVHESGEEGFVTARNSVIINDNVDWPPPFPILDIYSKNEALTGEYIKRDSEAHETNNCVDCSQAVLSGSNINLTSNENKEHDTFITCAEHTQSVSAVSIQHSDIPSAKVEVADPAIDPPCHQHICQSFRGDLVIESPGAQDISHVAILELEKESDLDGNQHVGSRTDIIQVSKQPAIAPIEVTKPVTAQLQVSQQPAVTQLEKIDLVAAQPEVSQPQAISQFMTDPSISQIKASQLPLTGNLEVSQQPVTTQLEVTAIAQLGVSQLPVSSQLEVSQQPATTQIGFSQQLVRSLLEASQQPDTAQLRFSQHLVPSQLEASQQPDTTQQGVSQQLVKLQLEASPQPATVQVLVSQQPATSQLEGSQQSATTQQGVSQQLVSSPQLEAKLLATAQPAASPQLEYPIIQQTLPTVTQPDATQPSASSASTADSVVFLDSQPTLAPVEVSSNEGFSSGTESTVITLLAEEGQQVASSQTPGNVSSGSREKSVCFKNISGECALEPEVQGFDGLLSPTSALIQSSEHTVLIQSLNEHTEIIQSSNKPTLLIQPSQGEPSPVPDLSSPYSYPAVSVKTELDQVQTPPPHPEVGPPPPPPPPPQGPPPPPPPPPVGYITQGIPPVSKTRKELLKEKTDKEASGTLKKQKCSRERALLEQLSGLDETFANFLRSNLNIKTTDISRERTDSECDYILRPKCRNRTDTNGSDSCKDRRRDSVRIKTTEEPVAVIKTADPVKDTIETVGTNTTDTCPGATVVSSAETGPLTESETVAQCGIETKHLQAQSSEGKTAAEKRSLESVSEISLSVDKVTTGVSPVQCSQAESVRKSPRQDRTRESPGQGRTNVIDSTGAMTAEVALPLHSTVSTTMGTSSTVDDSIATSNEQVHPAQVVEAVNNVENEEPANNLSHDTVDKSPVKDRTKTMPVRGQSCDTHLSVNTSKSPKNPPHLSKSDSGYSEKINIGDEDGDVPFKKKELTVDQAMQRYAKTFGLVSNTAQPARQRVLSERSEYSEYSGSSDEEMEADGVAMRERRTRDTRSYNSRRSSTDSSEDGFNQNVRDLKAELKELEEKFRKSMVANASLDNEKCQLMFQVDLLKDRVEESEESTALVSKELREKTREHELLRRDHQEKVRAVQLLETAIEEQQAMLQERGLVLVGQEAQEEDLPEEEQECRTRAIVSQETAHILAGLGPGPLDVRIKRLASQRDDLQDSVRRLKLDLEEERSKSSLQRGLATQEEIERETKKAMDDYKFKMQKSEQEILTLQANVARLESQVVRFKTAADTAEQAEENLKSERRKMQRELRDAVTKNEELETANKHLEKRLDKLKTAKSNLLKEL